jgi:hypothetical protein
MGGETMRPELNTVFAATRLRLYEDTEFLLVRLPPHAYLPLLSGLVRLHDSRFQSVVRAPAEVTLIAPVDLWAGLRADFPEATIDTPWRLITLDITIPLDVYGYMEQVARVCAEQGASVIMVSAYSTDHLLVTDARYAATRDALQAFIDQCRAATG